MGNKVSIIPTKFKDVRDGPVNFGFRAYDDYEQTYGNSLNSISDFDLDFLQDVIKQYGDDKILGGMLDFCRDNQQGLYIGSEWYEFDEIKHIL